MATIDTKESDRIVFQPCYASWPDSLASFEAFSSVDEGRKFYPGLRESEWVEVRASDIEGVSILDEQSVYVPTMADFLCTEG
jgi:hypothetical protein